MKNFWRNNYKFGIAHEISPVNKSIVDVFFEAVNKHQNKDALTCNGSSITFGEWKNLSLSLANGLSQLGIKKGDRVAIMLPNSIQYPIAVCAVLALGAVVVNINPMYTADEIGFAVENAGAKTIIVLDLLANKLEGFREHYGTQIITTNIADPYPFLKRFLIKNVQKYIQKVIPALNFKTSEFRDLCALPPLNNAITTVPDDLAFIQYTGATTGRPKGAMLTHGNIVANLMQIDLVLTAQNLTLGNQIVICALPLYHIFSLTANLFTFTFNGSRLVMIPNPKDVKAMVKVINSTPFTVFNSLDTLYHKLLDTPEFVNVPHPTYKYGISGGMATRVSVAKEWQRVTGTIPANCYGLSETSPAVCMSYLTDEYDGAVGFPIPSTEISLRDIHDVSKEAAFGLEGVIFIRGPQVMKGYWNNPEQTQKAINEDGWLNTGDIGKFSEEGKLFITSRVVEMVNVSGFNVYPAEVERVIDELSYVKEVAVVGLPDERTGEAVAAFVILQDGAIAQSEDIRSYCKQHLTRYKIPHKVFIAGELPKTAIGKLDKKKIVADYLANKN